MSVQTIIVRDVPERGRFEMLVEGQVAFLDYHHEGDVFTLVHAEVPPALNGRGFGSALVRGALEQIRDSGARIRPVCSFVAAYVARHPEYNALRAAPTPRGR